MISKACRQVRDGDAVALPSGASKAVCTASHGKAGVPHSCITCSGGVQRDAPAAAKMVHLWGIIPVHVGPEQASSCVCRPMNASRTASSRLRPGDSLPALRKPIPESPFKQPRGFTASFSSFPPLKYTLCGAALLLIITLQVGFLSLSWSYQGCIASSRSKRCRIVLDMGLLCSSAVSCSRVGFTSSM